MKPDTFFRFLLRPHMGRRLLALALSVPVVGICLGIFKILGFGVDPCATFTMGVAARTGISFGTCQMLLNVVLFIPALLLRPRSIGIGTVYNMVAVGYIADFCIYLVSPHLPEGGLSMSVRLASFAVCMVFFLLSVSFYIVVDLGVVPYDTVPQIISARTPKHNFRLVRVIWDVSFLTAGFLLGSTVGLTTIITGFCLGPAIAAVSAWAKPWFE